MTVLLAFCLLSVIRTCKQKLKQCNYSFDQSGLLTGFQTHFTSSEERGETDAFAGYYYSNLETTLFEIQTRDIHTPLPRSRLEGLLYIMLTLRLISFCLLAGGNPQPTMSEAFLSNCVFMTYKWFLSSEELLKKFMQRYPWLYESKVGSFFFYHDKNIVLMFVHVYSSFYLWLL